MDLVLNSFIPNQLPLNTYDPLLSRLVPACFSFMDVQIVLHTAGVCFSFSGCTSPSATSPRAHISTSNYPHGRLRLGQSCGISRTYVYVTSVGKRIHKQETYIHLNHMDFFTESSPSHENLNSLCVFWGKWIPSASWPQTALVTILRVTKILNTQSTVFRTKPTHTIPPHNEFRAHILWPIDDIFN